MMEEREILGGGAAAPSRACWELLGTGSLPGQSLLQANGAGGKMSVWGVVVVVGGCLAPGACGSPPHDDGRCLGGSQGPARWGVGVFLPTLS